MAGGDFKSFNRNFEELKRRFYKRKTFPIVCVHSLVVSENDPKHLPEHKAEICAAHKECYELLILLNELKKAIEFHLYELRDTKGKWEARIAEIDAMIETLQAEQNEFEKLPY